MAETFSELGIPFPLFEGPTCDAVGFVGAGECDLCSRAGFVFALQWAGVIETCPSCALPTEVDWSEDATPCVRCAAAVPAPRGLPDEDPHGCYTCVRAGSVVFTKDTPLGMIRWEDALRGSTHGRPMRPLPPPEPYVEDTTAPDWPALDDSGLVSESGWVRKRLPRAGMFELLRTPGFHAWQGDRWELDDERPMIYVGRWAARQFREHAPDGDAARLFNRIVRDPPDPLSDWLAEDPDDESGIGVYVFRSMDGTRWAANWDCD